MLSVLGSLRIYLAREPADMHKGLTALPLWCGVRGRGFSAGTVCFHPEAPRPDQDLAVG